MSTTLNCLSFMQTQKDQDPCTTAQQVGQLCSTQYNVSPTNFNESNYIPSITTANDCTCSWSIYNLLSACSYCVGQDQYPSWSTWLTNCGSHSSNNSYLPSGLSLSSGIPYWAATNPSTWENGVFNLAQASGIGSLGGYSDVTGGPLPTSTSNASGSHTSGVSAGAVAGGVIGAIAIIIIGILIIFLARRRRRTTSIGGVSIDASQVAAAPPPSIRSRTQPPPSGYAYIPPGPTSPRVTSPTRSMTSLSPLTSPISSGFSSSQGHLVASPISDAADMITPFLIMDPRRTPNRPTAEGPRTGNSKTAEAQTERIASSSGQHRTRLNPPPYSASAEPGPPPPPTGVLRRLSMKKQKRRKDSVSGKTTHSGHSRTSTKESARAFDAGPQIEGQPRAVTFAAATAETVANTGVGSEDSGNARKAHGQDVSHRLPAV